MLISNKLKRFKVKLIIKKRKSVFSPAALKYQQISIQSSPSPEYPIARRLIPIRKLPYDVAKKCDKR